MTGWQLLLCAFLYTWTAFDYARDDRWGMFIAFICYAVANVGFAWDAVRH